MTTVLRSLIAITLLAGAADAQTARNAQDTVVAYGSRLDAPGEIDATLNLRRYNNRINNRIDNRLSTRIERFTVNASANPVAAYERSDAGSTTQVYEQAGNATRQGQVGSVTTAMKRGSDTMDNQYPDADFNNSTSSPR